MMHLPALRSIAKINSNVLQNSSRFFSYKFEMTPVNRTSPETTDEAQTAASEEPATPSFRYNVCQPRTSPLERTDLVKDINYAQRQSAQAAIEQQHLQPSMLPEYYQTNMDRSVLLDPEPEPSEHGRINPTQRTFQMSKTCANAIFPLKSIKLANPFPEPVKMMMSRTVSDDEKAEQMLADSRSQRNMSHWTGKPPSNFRSFSTDVKRWYSVSSDPDKCKKLGVKEKKPKKGCPSMKLKGCAPIVRKSCDRVPPEIKCKKQEAPYPAYSEFCHEDPDLKPSSCRMCPWPKDENPNFKPQKKKFHTSSSANLKRSGLEIEQSEAAPERAEEAAAPAREEDLEGVLCDMRKPDCEKPNLHRCPPGTTKAEREKKHKPQERKKKQKPKKAASTRSPIEDVLNRRLLPTEPGPVLSLKKPDEQAGCKIKKFKFPACKQVKKAEEEVEEKCPKKKKKKIIRDCPKTDEKKKGETLQEFEQVVEYRLMAKKKDKCPRIDRSTDPNAIDKDRCKPDRPGVSKTCPGDLLKRKKKGPKDKKEAGELIPPVESEPEKPRRPQPTLRRI